MSALYQIRYQGVAGQGHGALYVGRGTVLGIDITGSRYHGSFSRQGAQLVGSGTLTSAGATLVTGKQLAAGQQVQFQFTLPEDFAGNRFYQVIVDGMPVQVAFDVIGDVP